MKVNVDHQPLFQKHHHVHHPLLLPLLLILLVILLLILLELNVDGYMGRTDLEGYGPNAGRWD